MFSRHLRCGIDTSRIHHLREHGNVRIFASICWLFRWNPCSGAQWKWSARCFPWCTSLLGMTFKPWRVINSTVLSTLNGHSLPLSTTSEFFFFKKSHDGNWNHKRHRATLQSTLCWRNNLPLHLEATHILGQKDWFITSSGNGRTCEKCTISTKNQTNVGTHFRQLLVLWQFFSNLRLVILQSISCHSSSACAAKGDWLRISCSAPWSMRNSSIKWNSSIKSASTPWKLHNIINICCEKCCCLLYSLKSPWNTQRNFGWSQHPFCLQLYFGRITSFQNRMKNSMTVENLRPYSSTFLNFLHITFHFSFFSQIMLSNIDMQMILLRCMLFISSISLRIPSVVSPVKIFLELHGLPINPIQFVEVIDFWTPQNLILPKFNRIVSHFS